MNDKVKKFLKLYSSCLKARNPKIWIFGAWFGNKYADNSKYLFIEANKYKKIRPIWIADNQKVVDKVREDGYEAYMMHSSEAIRLQLEAKYFFTSTGFQDVAWEYTGNAITYELWHGIPLKKIGWDDTVTPKKKNLVLYCIVDALRNIPRRKEYIIATSKAIKDIYMSCFKKDSKHVLIYGQPRNDCFYNGDSEIKNTFSNGSKIILYMPTHRNSGRTIIDCNKIFDLKALDAFCKDNDFVFLIKKHYYHRSEKTFLDNLSNIIDITDLEYDPQELLYATDILVTDYSSCYYDYLLLDRPILFYNYDYDNYIINDREMYYNYDEITPGIKAHTFNEFIDALKKTILDGDDPFVEERKKIKDLFYDRSGQKKVSPQIIEDILKQEGMYK